MKELTQRQQDILNFIMGCMRDQGRPPTIAEIATHFNIASTNGVHEHLTALTRKGYIVRSSKARSIELSDKVARANYTALESSLPLLGRVAAGMPMLAQENVEDYVTVAPDQCRSGAFCLRVSGESMIEAGILDGDVIIVDQNIQPKSGDIVVALIDDEATVKYFYPRREMVELRPANSSMQPMLISSGAMTIQGVVVGLQRRFR